MLDLKPNTHNLSTQAAKTSYAPNHRVIFHTEERDIPHIYHAALEAEDSISQLSRKLDLLVELHIATGGHVETFINEQIGWVVAIEQDVNAE